eukprot:3923954-Rhodomonas_salina.3
MPLPGVRFLVDLGRITPIALRLRPATSGADMCSATTRFLIKFYGMEAVFQVLSSSAFAI